MSSLTNPVLRARELGQSIWYDDLSCELLDSGRLADMVREDGLGGVTTNPAIFEKAIAHGPGYDGAIAALVRAGVTDPAAICRALMVADVRRAADVLSPVYRSSGGVDGYVSLEVPPDLAQDAAGTVNAARQLAALVDRPNLMIKVPATLPGLAAIEQLTGEGFNVNATLIFAVETYLCVAEAYQRGLEARLAAGPGIARISSVASFFVSRIDTAVDALLQERIGRCSDGPGRECLRVLLGQAAIASARIAYGEYRMLLETPRWEALAARGARPQRLLWASTGTKNPAFGPARYVDELVGAGTVNTMPGPTYAAFRGGVVPQAHLEGGVKIATAMMDGLAAAGISMQAVTDRLLGDGLGLFVRAQQRLLEAIARKVPELVAA
jgi:transaldolase